MAIGIAQLIDQKVNNLRGIGADPNAVAQQSMQQGQLLDALAAQKAVYDKQKAMQEMQANASTEPRTVVEQNDNALRQMNAQQMAQQVGGLARMQAARQQQGAQNQAQQRAAMPQRPMGAPSPMGQGIAQIPAQNMSARQMARGGIVSFADGGQAHSQMYRTEQDLISEIKSTQDPARKEQLIALLMNMRKTQPQRPQEFADGGDVKSMSIDELKRALAQAPEEEKAALRAELQRRIKGNLPGFMEESGISGAMDESYAERLLEKARANERLNAPLGDPLLKQIADVTSKRPELQEKFSPYQGQMDAYKQRRVDPTAIARDGMDAAIAAEDATRQTAPAFAPAAAGTPPAGGTPPLGQAPTMGGGIPTPAPLTVPKLDTTVAPAQKDKMSTLAEQGIESLVNTDRVARGKSDADYYREATAVPEDVRKRREEEIARRRASVEEQYGDTDRNRRQDLIKALIGAGGKRNIGSVLGGAGAAGMASQEGRRSKYEEGIAGIEDRLAGYDTEAAGLRKGAADVGIASRRDADAERRAGVTAAGTLAGQRETTDAANKRAELQAKTAVAQMQNDTDYRNAKMAYDSSADAAKLAVQQNANDVGTLQILQKAIDDSATLLDTARSAMMMSSQYRNADENGKKLLLNYVQEQVAPDLKQIQARFAELSGLRSGAGSTPPTSVGKGKVLGSRPAQ